MIKFERDTDRARAYQQLLMLPPETVVCWFGDEAYGHFWVTKQKTYVGGYVPTMLDYTTVPKRVDGKYPYRLAWPDETDEAAAIKRFLLLVDGYKRRYGLQTLSKSRIWM